MGSLRANATREHVADHIVKEDEGQAEAEEDGEHGRPVLDE